MKIFALLATVAFAEEEGRAMSLDKKIENAQNKCSVYMEKAMVCEPPSTKIGKYSFRLDKVLLDAKHHLKVGKCDPEGAYSPYRRRREDEDTMESLEQEFNDVMEEINASDDDQFAGKQYGSAASQGQLNKLEGLCQRFINQVFNDGSLADCAKLGSWKNRSAHIFKDLVLMKNVCLKQAEEADMPDNSYGGGNGGGNGGGGNNGGNYGGGKPKPTKAPAYQNTAKPKPTKKPKKAPKPPKY